jgi:hypothetical protein
MKRIEIHSNKKKAFLYFIVYFIIMITLIIFLFKTQDFSLMSKSYKKIIQNILSMKDSLMIIIGIIVCGLGSYFSLKSFLSEQVLLTIDDEGIDVDPKNNKLIFWNQIDDFSEVNVKISKLLVIHVKNPEEIIKLEKNYFYKFLLKINFKNYGSPMTISHGYMDIGFEELYDLLKSSFHEIKRKT